MCVEEFKNATEEAFVKYFNNNFANMNVEVAVNEAMKRSVIKLSAIYCQFDFLRQSLELVLNNDKNISTNVSEDYKKQIKYDIETTNIIWNNLDNLIKIVVDRITR